MTKFKFFRDKYGVHVYYAGMNRDARIECSQRSLTLNESLPFDPATTIVVPAVTRLSSVTKETQQVGYRSNKTNKTMTVVDFNNRLACLEGNVNSADSDDIEATTRAEVELRLFIAEWSEETQEIDVHTDYEFEIEDIAYPADDRMIPIRHYDEKHVNYFTVNGTKVAMNLAHALCQTEGFGQNDSGKRKTYNIRYNSLSYWRIEGRDVPTEPIDAITLRDEYVGDSEECRAYINSIECAVRACFDLWQASYRQPDGLTVGMVTDHLDRIEQRVKRIDSKIKTKREFEGCLAMIQRVKQEIVEMGKETLDNPVG